MRKLQKLSVIRQMHSWWNSVEVVSCWSTWANWIVAISGICALVFSQREGRLADRIANESAEQQIESDRQRDSIISANELQTKQAVRDVALANERTAIIDKEAATLRLNLEALKQQVDPRDISDPMRLKFLELTKDAPKGRIEITYVTDGDARFFALKIGSLLNEAGYDAPKSLDEMGAFTGLSPSGVYFKSGDAKDLVGILLQRAFLEIGIESGASVSEYQNGTEIHVGSRQ